MGLALAGWSVDAVLVGSVASLPQQDADVVAFLVGGDDVEPVAMRRQQYPHGRGRSLPEGPIQPRDFG